MKKMGSSCDECSLTGREVNLVALLPSVPGQERTILLIQVCASLADPRVKQSEVRSLSEAMVELAVAEGTIVTWRTDETRGLRHHPDGAGLAVSAGDGAVNLKLRLVRTRQEPRSPRKA